MIKLPTHIIYFKSVIFLVFFFLSSINLGQPVTGNITTSFSSPGTKKTFSHTQDTGTDRLLVVITHNPNGVNAFSVKYNNVALSNAGNWLVASWQNHVWYLVNPDEGANNVEVSFTGNQTNKCGFIALSFTNATGIGATGINTTGGYNTLRSVSLNVAENSKIIGTGLTTAGVTNIIRLPSPTILPFEWNSGLCCSKGSFGGVSPALSAGSQTLVAQDYNGSVYPIAIEVQSSSPLPIELLRFNATPTLDNIVQLEWETASELNNDYFTVERSIDIVDWKEVVQIEGAGESYEPLEYSAIDENPVLGTSFYRLKQTDFDGKFDYSPIKVVNVLNDYRSESFTYPNPTKRFITIKNGDVKNLEELFMCTVQGKDVTSDVSFELQGDNLLKLDIKGLRPGVYYLRVANHMYRLIRE